MKSRKNSALLVLAIIAAACGSAAVEGVSDDVIDAQREALAAAFEAEPFGPQAPRDIESTAGSNEVTFDVAPPYTEMNLCNIHFHEGAEHKGGEFTTYAGNGDGEGHDTGYVYDGELTDDELAEYDGEVGVNEHGLSLIHI